MADALLTRYARLSAEDKLEVVHTLSSRPGYGRRLTEALRSGDVPRRDVPAYVARLLRRVVGNGFVEVWGPIDELSADKEALLALPFDGGVVSEKLVEQTGKIGEKIEISDYQLVSGENISSYIHAGSKIGVVLAYKAGEKAEEAAKFFRGLAMHIAAMNPSIMHPDEFDPDFVAKETEAIQAQIKAENELNAAENLGKPQKNIPQYVSRRQLTPEVMAQAEEDIKKQLTEEGKPEKIWDKIIPGKLERFISDNTLLDQERCLLSQVFALDDTKTVEAAIKDFGNGAELIEFKRAAVG